MKHYLALLLLLVVQLSIAQKRSEPVKVISAKQQNWFTGAEPGRAGTSYTIKVEIQTQKPITFKNLWIGKEQADFEIQTFFRDPGKRLSKGDSALLVHVGAGKAQPLSTKALPFQYIGAALVEYEAAGKTHYLAVSKFEILNPVKGE
jgi:hypothetical protein